MLIKIKSRRIAKAATECFVCIEGKIIASYYNILHSLVEDVISPRTKANGLHTNNRSLIIYIKQEKANDVTGHCVEKSEPFFSCSYEWSFGRSTRTCSSLSVLLVDGFYGEIVFVSSQNPVTCQ